MKINILALLLLLPLGIARAQEYVPLLDTNKVWNIYENWLWWGETHPHYLERCETDTNRFIFKKEWHSMHIEELGYLTEDTASKKVYYTKIHDDHDMLLYDFSLVEGDESIIGYIVEKVDSIQLLDGTYRKRIMFDDGGYYYWIEGIGSYFGGLLWSDWLFKKHIPEAWLLCYSQNDTLLYIDDRSTSCNYRWTENNTETLKKTISPIIYPNPFSQKISISFNNPVYGEKPEVIVKALDGRVVYYETLNSDNSLDLSFLITGIYFLVLKHKDYQYTTKIIKQ